MVKNKNLGLIHIYTGDGKGKTTAAFGLVLRALAYDYKILIVQFFKFGTGEKQTLKKLNDCFKEKNEKNKNSKNNIVYLQFNVNSEIFMQYTEELREKNKKKFFDFLKKIEEEYKNNYDIIVFDEIVYAYHMNFISEEELKNFILKKPESSELILTGRDFPKKILDLADYITEMKKIKHPFEKKVTARRGIEF